MIFDENSVMTAEEAKARTWSSIFKASDTQLQAIIEKINEAIDENEIEVNSIRPDWLRRKIAEAVFNDDTITIGISHKGRQKSEYYVRLIDSNWRNLSSPVNPDCLKDCEELKYEDPRNA